MVILFLSLYQFFWDDPEFYLGYIIYLPDAYARQNHRIFHLLYYYRDFYCNGIVKKRIVSGKSVITMNRKSGLISFSGKIKKINHNERYY